MRLRLTLLSLLLLTLAITTQAQSPIDHWETVVSAGDTVRYFRGTSEPPPTWRQIGFADGGWNSGPEGVGFGDSDDYTSVSSCNSIYWRRAFTIVDTSEILLAVLHMDYDDGFIAYLNDVEIARANLGSAIGDHPAWFQFANASHEAEMYAGGTPDNYYMDKAQIAAILRNGTNVLAIQVHNNSAGSSDLTSNAWLSVALDTSATVYGPTPSWFSAPPLSSNLPLVFIDVGAQTISDDPKVDGTMGIVWNGAGLRNGITDPRNDYNGNISIEIRGSSSQMFPKKSYGFETQDALGANLNVSLLGMPKENDWILYAPYTDKTYMRDAMNFHQFRSMGHYTTRTEYCEVFVNRQYMGIYILEEKIKVDDGRVDIPAIEPDDNAGDSLTGGYIFKADKETGSGATAWVSIENPAAKFLFHDPDETDITLPQSLYLIDYVTDMETVLLSPSWADPVNGYRKYLDPGSFTDFLLTQELAHNVDGYRLSSFFHKNRNSNGGKLRAGPSWDCNLCFGNADYCDGWRTDSWAYDFNTVCSGSTNEVPFWWGKLMTDTRFMEETRCRWDFLRTGLLHEDTLMAWVDSVSTLLTEAEARDHARWPILGTYVWPNAYVGTTWAEDLTYFKTWLSTRLAWMDANLPTPPPACTVAGFDSLRISELAYHPSDAFDPGDWVELYNGSSTVMDLGGWRMKDENPANIYEFPLGTLIQPDSFLVVCQDTAQFDALFPDVNNRIGNFHWNLENSSDMIRLYDPGYTMSLALRYRDSLPWPVIPDGGDSTLQILDVWADVNDPANWTQSCAVLGTPGARFIFPCPVVVSTTDPQPTQMVLWPNPTQTGIAYVRVPASLLQGAAPSLWVTDLTGRVVTQQEIRSALTSLDAAYLPSGVYVVTVVKDGLRWESRKWVVE